MRKGILALAGALCVLGSSAQAQSVAELRAQYQQTEAMLNEAEAAGMDPSLTASLRESLEGLRQVIDEMERDQASNSTYAEPQVAETAPPPIQPAEPNQAAQTCSRFGFDETNYRQTALADGNDQQIRSLCGQAYEYYTMYKRALGQQHPEAWKTYDAHKQSAMVVNNFYGETRVLPTEGIQEDTRTASQMAAEQAARTAAAQAGSPPEPPRAPPCDGCVSPQ